jgi:hypothetical protein
LTAAAAKVCEARWQRYGFRGDGITRGEAAGLYKPRERPPWRAGQETAQGWCGSDPSSGPARRDRRWGMTGGPHLSATVAEGRDAARCWAKARRAAKERGDAHAAEQKSMGTFAGLRLLGYLEELGCNFYSKLLGSFVL